MYFEKGREVPCYTVLNKDQVCEKLHTITLSNTTEKRKRDEPKSEKEEESARIGCLPENFPLPGKCVRGVTLTFTESPKFS